MRANVEENLYIIRQFSKDIEDYVYTVEEIQEILILGPYISREKKEKELYDLQYHRIGYLRKSKLRHLYKITNLKTLIPYHVEPKFYEVYETTKILKRISKEVGKRKSRLLAQVSIDIYSLLLVTINNNHYFIKIINNYTYKYQVILVPLRKAVPIVLKKQRKQVKFKSKYKLKVARIDNIGELIKEYKEQKKDNRLKV